MPQRFLSPPTPLSGMPEIVVDFSESCQRDVLKSLQLQRRITGAIGGHESFTL
jgi:hypothetical protein